LGPFHPFLET